jgi:hypothetical protein
MGKKAKKRQDSKKKANKQKQQKHAVASDSITAIFKVWRMHSRARRLCVLSRIS